MSSRGRCFPQTDENKTPLDIDEHSGFITGCHAASDVEISSGPHVVLPTVSFPHVFLHSENLFSSRWGAG